MSTEEAILEERPPSERLVLVLPPTSADGQAIKKLFGACDIHCAIVGGVDELCAAARRGAGAVLVSEEALLAGAAPLLDIVQQQPVWSDLPMLVLSRWGSEPASLTQILPQLGNVSVVERPIRSSTLVSLIRSSLRARSRQYQVREHLAAQERAQQIIREGERRYRLLIDNITDYAIFMIDVQGRVASWNSGAQHMLGYAAAEILGRPATVFFAPEDQLAGTLRREMSDSRATGRASSSGWRVCKGGERLFAEGVLSAVRDDEGSLLGYAKFMKDVTDKHRIECEREQLLDSERAARNEVERSGRMKDEFLATLGHELRTPLNAILGWSQVLSRSQGLSGNVADGLHVIERNARAQAQIIEDLLDMSSIISGKVRLDVQPVDLASIVEAAVKAVQPAAEAKGIRLRAVLDPQAGVTSGDPNRLQQVFWNLLTNAVKFTPTDGGVNVVLERTESQLQVSIADTGEGIEAAFLPHVFDRFRQADASTSRRHGGLGLGLSIVKQLVELHGGTVNAMSKGGGMGSTFKVTLPGIASPRAAGERAARERPARSAFPQTQAQLPHTDLAGMKILVVDDEPYARALIQRLLQECAVAVTVAASAGEALDSIVRETPDALISDIGMPGEDGYSLIRRIRALTGEKGQIPAIALTAYARVEDRIKAVQAGYHLHLSKPVEPVELMAMLNSLLRRAGT